MNGSPSDPTRMRSEVSSRFWNLFRAETDADAYLSSGSFPVQLYLNGTYMGLFLLNRPSGYATASRRAFVQNGSSPGCLFKSEPERYEDSETGSGFSYLSSPSAAGLAKEAEAWESFCSFHQFVRESDDERFAKHLKDHADVTELIDALLFAELFFAGDAGETDIIWYTDDGTHWHADFLSLECSIGLYSTGSTVAPEFRLPIRSQDTVTYIGNSKLWERIVKLFPDLVAERYAALRSVVSAESASSYFHALYDAVPAELTEMEKELFPTAAYRPGASPVDEFLTERFRKMDEIVSKGEAGRE